MAFIPHTEADVAAMLATIGVTGIEDLFDEIPPDLRVKSLAGVPPELNEMEIGRLMTERARADGVPLTFIGAGAYEHHIPAAVWAITTRGEFYSAYTPYQAEASQGTLQLIYEFQTMIARLTGMEVANASMYDGSTALTEAVLMAERLTGRHRVLVARSVHPEYRHVLQTYAKNLGIEIEEIGYTESGQFDRSALKQESLAQAAAIVVQSPNFFGVIEELPALAEAAHAAGSLLITSIAEAVSLGIVRPPAEADIVAMEGQSFGIPPSYGGPYVGVIATRDKYVRQMPGRLAGQTTDAEGRRGFVLTLATREQHIRREKATSNICTNEALYALAATIHLCLLGKEGLREQALQNLAKARFAQAELEKIPGVRRVFSGPSFNEFVLEFPRSVKMVNADLLREKIVGPFALGIHYPELTKRALVCVTETTPRAEIERLAAAIKRILERPV